MADRSQIEEIKERLNIVDVAGSYLQSMRKSGHNYFALCPFHNEKTPSFSINPDLGIYKCFGCGESGDVITFIQKMEGLDFPEAMEMAAEKAGVQLRKTFSPADKKRQEQKLRILKANELAAKFFNYILLSHKGGNVARDYILKRKIEKKEIEKFRIGYAPDSFDSLLKFLKKEKFNEQELISFGLLVNKNGKIYDKFRGRLMFPVFNIKGDIVGFSGRVIDPDALGPKYLNSPETIVFNKSSLLYGLFQARDAIRKENFVLLSEGQIDVLSSHKEGIENIVAPLGTSLTELQLKTLKRYCDNLYFSFDTDLAGEKALLRSLEMAQRTGFAVKAVNIGKYTDADELIRENPNQWPLVVQKAEPVIEHMVRRLSKRMDLGDARGKAEFAKIILPLIDSLADRIEQSHYIKKISVLIDTEEEVLREELDRFKTRKEEKLEGEDEEKIYLKKPESLSKEEYLVALCLQNVDAIPAILKELGEFDKVIKSKRLEKILNLIFSKKDVKKVSAELKDDEKELFEKLILMPVFAEDEEGIMIEVRDVAARLRTYDTKEKINDLKKKIREMEAKGDEPEELMGELGKLTKKLKSLS